MSVEVTVTEAGMRDLGLASKSKIGHKKCLNLVQDVCCKTLVALLGSNTQPFRNFCAKNWQVFLTVSRLDSNCRKEEEKSCCLCLTRYDKVAREFNIFKMHCFFQWEQFFTARGDDQAKLQKVGLSTFRNCLRVPAEFSNNNDPVR